MTPAPRLLVQPRETLLKEALSPFADNPPRGIDTGSNYVIGQAISGKEDDLRANYVAIR
jgi:hypothetical protein